MVFSFLFHSLRKQTLQCQFPLVLAEALSILAMPTGRRSLEVLPATDGSQQSRWITTGIGNNFLETANPKRARSVLKQRYSHAEEFHRKLWPGIQVPNITGDNSSKDVATASTMPTSLMVAYIGLMISQQKRGVQFRQRAFELLKAFVDRLAVCSPTLDFLMCDADGVGGWQTQTMSTGHACVPWTKQFFQRHLQMTWLNDLSNPNIPWVTSYPVEGQIHLADWIAFSLDFPAWVANKPRKQGDPLGKTGHRTFSFECVDSTGCIDRVKPDTYYY